MKVERVIIDVREPAEYESGHFEGAINIPPVVLMSEPSALNEVDRDIEVIVYCRTGSRSNAAIHILRQMGFTNLVNGINTDHISKMLLR